VAPDVPQMSQWQKRSKWTATASLANTSRILSKIAEVLKKTEDAKIYDDLYKKTSDAYTSVFTDGNGKLKEEFQTAYVLPIHFNMFDEATKKKAAANLAELVAKNDYKIGTGFPGTPYILFALADNGQEDAAFKMLLNTKCPSWLYEVKAGATTIWERWDGLDENGNCPIGDDGTDNMISYNHYASGAVGDFLYKRVAGIEPLEAGYKKFKIAPLVGGGLTSANAKVSTSYGDIISQWEIKDGSFNINVEIPIGTECECQLPNGESRVLMNGKYNFCCEI
jgi:alpha-L-rhamnosidase